jgi:hypothetical protein
MFFFIKRSNVYEYNFQTPQAPSTHGYACSKWKKLNDWAIELPRDTLLLAEKVYEYRGVVSIKIRVKISVLN